MVPEHTHIHTHTHTRTHTYKHPVKQTYIARRGRSIQTPCEGGRRAPRHDLRERVSTTSVRVLRLGAWVVLLRPERLLLPQTRQMEQLLERMLGRSWSRSWSWPPPFPCPGSCLSHLSLLCSCLVLVVLLLIVPEKRESVVGVRLARIVCTSALEMVEAGRPQRGPPGLVGGLAPKTCCLAPAPVQAVSAL